MIATGQVSVLEKAGAEGGALMGTTIQHSRRSPLAITPESKALTMQLNSQRSRVTKGRGQGDGIPGLKQLHGGLRQREGH